MLIEYADTEMGFLDYYSNADPNHKSIRGNGITTFLFHVAQCVIFNLTNHVKTILIASYSFIILCLQTEDRHTQNKKYGRWWKRL